MDLNYSPWQGGTEGSESTAVDVNIRGAPGMAVKDIEEITPKFETDILPDGDLLQESEILIGYPAGPNVGNRARRVAKRKGCGITEGRDVKDRLSRHVRAATYIGADR